jgi:hypothetical protein
VRLAILATLVVVLTTSCAGVAASNGPQGETATAPAGSTTATSSANPPIGNRKAVTVSGKGISKSKTFNLAGDYEVTWTAQADSHVGCYHGASLARKDGEYVDGTLVNEIFKDAKKHTGTTNLYGLDATAYYVDASSGCSWSFTFAPQ